MAEIPNVLQQFLTWARLKYQLHTSDSLSMVYFRERELWWCSLGMNVGYEQNGKNQHFERPVLIIKKFNRHLLWVVPLTSREKFGQYYYPVHYHGRNSFVILSQLRVISSKRLLRKIRTVSIDDFSVVLDRIKDYL